MSTNELMLTGGEESESDEEQRRRRIVPLSEAFMVIACVLVFFAFMSGLIGVFFPDGTSLTSGSDSTGLTAAARSGDVELGIDGNYADTERLAAGEILEITRRVQRRGASSLTWNDASVGESIAQDDAVQTFTRSGAILQVNNASQLTMSENSLIVFNQERPDPFLQKQESVLLIVDGELSGRIASETDARFSFNMKLADSDVILKPRNPGDEVQFLITVNDDKSATVNIHEGTAQIITPTGVIRTIGDQQAITIDPNGENLQVDELARPPRTAGPADDTHIKYRNVPKLVTFDWDAVESADRYRIVVARDQEFNDRIVDDDVLDTEFTHGALRPGTYYWYVRSRSGWSQSTASDVKKIHVQQDNEPPQLVLDPAPTSVRIGSWRLLGRTDSDASLFIDDKEVSHVDGRIDYTIDLKPGANIIVVQAVDSVGNLSYAPLLVTAR